MGIGLFLFSKVSRFGVMMGIQIQQLETSDTKQPRDCKNRPGCLIAVILLITRYNHDCPSHFKCQTQAKPLTLDRDYWKIPNTKHL